MSLKTKIIIVAVGVVLVVGAILYKAKVDGTSLPLAESNEARVERIYHNIVVQTGVSNIIPPIRVEDSDVINAYNNGNEIVVYTGLIKEVQNDDELAMVIAHEISHTTLMHLQIMKFYQKGWTADDQEMLESMADKMGALYALKAGYNVCLGREIWKRFKEKYGDYLGADHPDMAYRYDQLNVGCSR